MRPGTLPLFPEPEQAPAGPPRLDGWAVGDQVFFAADGAVAGRGRIIAVLPRYHRLVIRADKPDAIVSAQPGQCRRAP